MTDLSNVSEQALRFELDKREHAKLGTTGHTCDCLTDANKRFKKLGAETYHDSFYTQKDRWGFSYKKERMFRYYFNKFGTEIGHWCVAFNVVCIFNTPRKWGFEHSNTPLTRKVKQCTSG